MSNRREIIQIVSEAAPTSAALGDEWVQPSTGQLFKRVIAGNTVNWTPVLTGALTQGNGISITNTATGRTIESTTGSVSVMAGQAITAGAPVTINSSGLLVPVSPVVNISATPTAPAYANLVTAISVSANSKIFNSYNSTTGAYIVLFNGYPDGYLKYSVGSISGTTITEGTSGIFVSAVADLRSIAKVGSNKVIVFYTDGSPPSLKAILVQFTNTSASVLSGPITLSNSNGDYSVAVSPTAAVLPSISKVYILTREVSSSYVIGLNYTENAISLISKSPAISGFSNTFQDTRISIATDGNKLVIVCYNGIPIYQGQASVGTIQPDGSVVWTAPSLNLPRFGALAYEPKSNRFLYCGSDGSSTNTAHSLSLSDTTISQVYSTSFSANGFNDDISLVSSDSEGDFCTLITHDFSGSTNKTALRTIYNLSSSTFSVSAVLLSSNLGANQEKIHCSSYLGSGKVFDTIGYQGSFSTVPSYRVATVASFSQSAAYLGISAGSYSAGQPALVNTSGSINNAVSGLTTGSAYYVQLNGTLGTTPTTLTAGMALSPTSISVK